VHQKTYNKTVLIQFSCLFWR